MKKIYLLPLILMYTSVFSQQQEGLLVNPASIEFNLSKGQSGMKELLIINNLKEKKQLRFFIADWTRDTVGKHTYLNPGTINYSCSNWISLDKTFVEIEPGQTAKIDVKLKVPDTDEAIKSVKWAMIFVETIEEKKAPPTSGRIVVSMTTSMRIGVHVYQTPSNFENSEIKMLSFDPKPNSADSIYRIVCQNTGATQLQCKSYIELSDLTNNAKTILNYPDFPLFPEQKRYIDFQLPKNLSKGKYNVLAVVDAGMELPIEAAQATIEIK